MYEIQGRIYEEHGEYKCYLEVWTAETSTKALLFNAYEKRLGLRGDAGDEHLEIIEVLSALCTRIAEKREVPVF